MPYVAESGGDLVSPLDVSVGETIFCPGCGGEMGIRESHYNRGKFIARHFFHKSKGDCPGESNAHFKMKTIAHYYLEDLFPMAEVEEEVGIAGRYIADVLAEFPKPMKPFGKGLAVEVQHKNKGKDIRGTSQAYLRAGHSIYWAYQSDFDGHQLDFVEKRARLVWPDAVPAEHHWSGYHEDVKALYENDFFSPPEVEVNFPQEYWLAHDIEVASPRHGDLQTDWRLVDETWVRSQGRYIEWLTINQAPNDLTFLELWKKDNKTGTSRFIPIHVAPDDVSHVRAFAEGLQRLSKSDFEIASGEWDTVETMTTTGTASTTDRLSLVADPENDLLVRFRRSDAKGNSRSVSVPFRTDIGEALEEAAEIAADSQQKAAHRY